MVEIIKLLPVLIIAVIMNVAAGTWYNVNISNIVFDKSKLINGIIKAAIICAMFIGTAYCFDATDLSGIGITPIAIMNAAIILYVGKAVMSLSKILGVDTSAKNRG